VRFRELTLVDGSVVYVNLDRVRRVTEPVGVTVLWFSREDMVQVQETAHDVLDPPARWGVLTTGG
jgi:hypothetical protein